MQQFTCRFSWFGRFCLVLWASSSLCCSSSKQYQEGSTTQHMALSADQDCGETPQKRGPRATKIHDTRKWRPEVRSRVSFSSFCVSLVRCAQQNVALPQLPVLFRWPRSRVFHLWEFLGAMGQLYQKKTCALLTCSWLCWMPSCFIDATSPDPWSPLHLPKLEQPCGDKSSYDRIQLRMHRKMLSAFAMSCSWRGTVMAGFHVHGLPTKHGMEVSERDGCLGL